MCISLASVTPIGKLHLKPQSNSGAGLSTTGMYYQECSMQCYYIAVRSAIMTLVCSKMTEKHSTIQPVTVFVDMSWDTCRYVHTKDKVLKVELDWYNT